MCFVPSLAGARNYSTMLVSLYLRNFVIVREAELSLRDGMTAITGETGAGKSILIDALNLVLGGRTSSDIIRHGKDQSEIIASFDLTDCSDAIDWLKQQELEAEGDCVGPTGITRRSPEQGTCSVLNVVRVVWHLESPKR